MRSLLATSCLLLTTAIAQTQIPMDASAPGIQLPPTKDLPPAPNGDVLISDILSTERQIKIFAGFTRDISTVSTRLDTSTLNTTVLAPLNSALTSLPRKPWEDPRDGAGAMTEDRAQENMRRFTEAHVVTTSPWKEGEKVKTMGGGQVWWEKRGERAVVMPGEVEVESVAKRVANGEVWVIKGVVNYA